MVSILSQYFGCFGNFVWYDKFPLREEFPVRLISKILPEISVGCIDGLIKASCLVLIPNFATDCGVKV